MDRAKCLIFLKGQERTNNILSLTEDRNKAMYHVRFNGSAEKVFNYRRADVEVHKPVVLSPEFNIIYLDGREFTKPTAIYQYKEAGYFYLVRGDKAYLINEDRLKITHSALENKNASSVLSYLKEVSFVSPIRDEEGNRILSKDISA